MALALRCEAGVSECSHVRHMLDNCWQMHLMHHANIPAFIKVAGVENKHQAIFYPGVKNTSAPTMCSAGSGRRHVPEQNKQPKNQMGEFGLCFKSNRYFIYPKENTAQRSTMRPRVHGRSHHLMSMQCVVCESHFLRRASDGWTGNRATL